VIKKTKRANFTGMFSALKRRALARIKPKKYRSRPEIIAYCLNQRQSRRRGAYGRLEDAQRRQRCAPKILTTGYFSKTAAGELI
jgi:hypothetical protein